MQALSFCCRMARVVVICHLFARPLPAQQAEPPVPPLVEHPELLKAEDYFDYPDAVEFCQSIERHDVVAMFRQYRQSHNGAWHFGKQGMTFLMWSLLKDPDGKHFDTFKTVYFLSRESGLRRIENAEGPLAPLGGLSPMHIVIRDRPAPWLEYMLQRDAPVDLKPLDNGRCVGVSPLILAAASKLDAQLKLLLLLEAGAEINETDDSYGNVANYCSSLSKDDTLLLLLEHGADPLNSYDDQRSVFQGMFARQEFARRENPGRSSPPREKEIVTWLAAQGLSLAEEKEFQDKMQVQFRAIEEKRRQHTNMPNHNEAAISEAAHLEYLAIKKAKQQRLEYLRQMWLESQVRRRKYNQQALAAEITRLEKQAAELWNAPPQPKPDPFSGPARDLSTPKTDEQVRQQLLENFLKQVNEKPR